LDQRKWSEVSEAEFKCKFGQAVVGKSVRIQWKGGKSYVGRVTEFNEDDGNHKVVYTDGDVKWHDLDQRKWSEVSDAEIKRKYWQAVGGKPVRIQWKGGKSYVGRVTEFNEGNGNHKVVYTDGGVKWHALTWTRESGGGA
jgi:small nuclear ribonucleoprotein (snRNP)-like protein